MGDNKQGVWKSHAPSVLRWRRMKEIFWASYCALKPKKIFRHPDNNQYYPYSNEHYFDQSWWLNFSPDFSFFFFFLLIQTPKRFCLLCNISILLALKQRADSRAITLKWKGCQDDCPGCHWRYWRQASTFPLRTRTVTLTTFLFLCRSLPWLLITWLLPLLAHIISPSIVHAE